MNKHFLINVSNQKNAASGVRFISNFFTDKSSIKATLFYSAPKAPAVWENENNFENSQQQKMQEKKLLSKGKETLTELKQTCLDEGFLSQNIIEKLQTRLFTNVHDIIQEGEKGLYDAVVLGKRAVTIMEEAFEEDIGHTLYKEKFTFPLWLCRSSDPLRKNTLLYVDGSAASLQMADHVGFILGEEKKHNVDILAPESISSESNLMAQYKAALQQSGLTRDRIQTLAPVAGNPGKDILKRVGKNRYAAVALGRNSSEPSLLARLFRGPVCSVLFKELTDTSLWLCP